MQIIVLLLFTNLTTPLLLVRPPHFKFDIIGSPAISVISTPTLFSISLLVLGSLGHALSKPLPGVVPSLFQNMSTDLLNTTSKLNDNLSFPITFCLKLVT